MTAWPPRTAEISQEDRATLRALRASWRKVFRLTTIAQARTSLGLPDDTEARRRLAGILRSRQGTFPTVQRWGLPAVTLTEDEKLAGRWLVFPDEPGRDGLKMLAIAEARPQVLQIFEEVGLGRTAVEGDTATFKWRPDIKQAIGPLGFTFHTVTLDDAEVFNVP